jgi:hypothetical protein
VGEKYDMYGGLPPHMAGSDTSLAAALSVIQGAENIRRRVYRYIRDTGETGATCDEVEIALEGRHTTISARIRELSIMHAIVDTGDRRPTSSGRSARIYRACVNPSPEPPHYSTVCVRHAAGFCATNRSVPLVNVGAYPWRQETLCGSAVRPISYRLGRPICPECRGILDG